MSTALTSAGLLGIHALTALHPGAGTALGTVDLPVQRERHTGWPTIAGSALKGILRDACREQISRDANLDALPRHDDRAATDDKPAVVAKREGSGRERANNTIVLNELFGPPTAGSSEFAGAVSVTDARLLAYPVRSLKGVFAWVTCRAVLERYARDAEMGGNEAPPVPADVAPGAAATAKDSPCLIDGAKLLLEEFPFTRDGESADQPAWAIWIANHLLPQGDHYKATRERLLKTLVILSDDDFTHFVKYATEVTARIGLDYETKTVKGGALFYQEFLPTESLFYSVVIVNAARTRQATRSAAALMDSFAGMVAKVPVLQIGGDETTGKGFCSVRLNGGEVMSVESKTTPDQQRAKHAWSAVEEARKDAKGFPKYLGAARKLPVRIMASGLGQAVVYLRAKAAKTKALTTLILHITDWVLKQPPKGELSTPPPGDYDLVKAIIGTDKALSTADDLRRHTAETLAYLLWLNRFCEATGVKEEEVSE